MGSADVNEQANGQRKVEETVETRAAVNLSVVLDRSGSMRAIASDMTGGFATFIDEQRQEEGDCRVTLVQFDSQDPFEVLVDDQPLDSAWLDARKYVPRGSTPLLDAVGRMIARIDTRIAERSERGLGEEDQVVLIITDGLENASREYTHATVRDLIEARKAEGWTFAFLGADQDSFLEGGRLGFAASNRRDWDKTTRGTAEMWGVLSKSTLAYRTKQQYLRRVEADTFFVEEE